MGLRPLRDSVFGEVIEQESLHQGLLEDFSYLTAAFETRSSEAEGFQRGMVATLEEVVPKSHQILVVACGPECKELKPGDIAILPQFGGTMLTITDEEDGTYERWFCIPESSILAVYEED